MGEGRQYQALHSALQKPTVDINSAAEALTDHTNRIWREDSSSEVSLKESLWQTWQAVTSLAAATPYDNQESLVQVVKTVQEFGRLKRNGSNSDAVFNVDGAVLWTDLPLFGVQMREAWNGDASAEQWQNLNAFAAQLTAASYKPGPYDFALYGVWTIRDALESNAAKEKRFSEISAKDLDAAAMWFIYAADKLLRESGQRGLEGRSFEGKLARAGEGFKEKEWKGLNVDRWILWKETLQAISSSTEHKADKELLGKALESIETVETR